MGTVLESLLKWVQLPPWRLIGLGLALFAVWLIPTLAPQSFASAQLLAPYRAYLEIGWLVLLVFGLIEVLRQWYQRQEAEESALRHLSSLTPEERAVIAYCAMRNQQSVLLPRGSHAGETLRLKRIAVLQVSRRGRCICSLNPFVWDWISADLPEVGDLINRAIEDPSSKDALSRIEHEQALDRLGH